MAQPTCQEYLDFVHKVVTRYFWKPDPIVCASHFFPTSNAKIGYQYEMIRKNLIRQAMKCMVQDSFLIPSKSQDDRYTLNPNIDVGQYLDDRRLSEQSIWISNLQFNCRLTYPDLSSMRKLQTFLDSRNADSRATTESNTETMSSLPKPHEQIATYLAPGTPARAGLKRRRSSSISSNSSSGSDPSSPIPIGSPASSPPASEPNLSIAEQVSEQSTYFFAGVTTAIRQRLPHSLAADMDRLHQEYPDDNFLITDWISDYKNDNDFDGFYDCFKVFCRDCYQQAFEIETSKADNPENCLGSVELHLRSYRHTANVLLRLKREGKVPQETPACRSRTRSLKSLAVQKGYSLDNLSLFIEHCATWSFTTRPPLAQTSSNVPNMNMSADMSISQSEPSKPTATSKRLLFGRTQEEADQDRLFLNSRVDAQLPHITNPKAQVRTPVESQSLAALQPEFSRRLDALEGEDRKKRLQLEKHENYITEADVKIFGVEKKIKSFEGSRDEFVSSINRVQESMKTKIQTLETVQRRTSTKVDGVLGTIDRLETRTANVQKLILRHSDDITSFRAQGVETRALVECLKRRREDSDEMKRRILDLESREKDLQKENHAFRKETEDRFETLLQTVQQNLQTLSKRQKADVAALKKEIKDLEMVGEQQKSQISNLKTQLSLQIAQIEGTSTRRSSTRSTAAGSL